MKIEEIKDRILEALEAGDMTAGEIAVALGYYDKYGVPYYAKVAKPLKRLFQDGQISKRKKYIHRALSRPVIYSIVKNDD
jgi:hypothetical protein